MRVAIQNFAANLLLFLLATSFLRPVQAASPAGAAQLISGSPQTYNLGGNGDSGLAIISQNGRFVLFASTANNLTLTNNKLPGTAPLFNVFLRDTSNQTTTLVSVNQSGTGGGNGDSFPTGISTNGQFALFESSATDLAANATNGTNIFVRDVINGTTTVVSVSDTGGPANGTARGSVLTPDGRHVAFTSTATNLVAGDTNNLADVFVRDLQAGTTTLVSVWAVTNAYNPIAATATSSESPEITPDGGHVAFYSTATNLVPGVNTAGEIYLRDLVAGKTLWASTNGRALFKSVFGNTNVVCCNYSISDNGQFVAYEAVAVYPRSGSPHGLILRYSVATGLTDLIHTNANEPLYPFEIIHNLSMTPDGRFVAFVANLSTTSTTQNAAYLWDAQTGTNTLISAGPDNVTPASGFVDSPVVSSNGQFVAFISSAGNLVTNALTGPFHVYLRDRQAVVTKLVDANTNTTGAGVEPTTVPVMSADGRVVAFDCASLLPANRHLVHDIFARNVPAGATTLVSAAHPALVSQTPDGGSGFTSSSVSSNGQFIAFYSDGDNLVAGDTNGCRDVFVHNLVGGTNILVSVSTNGTAPGDGPSSNPTISADGRYVAFTSSADNLVPGDNNQAQDVFVRDLATGKTTLVSVIANNVNPGNGASSSPVLSADGRFVLFQSLASNLAAGSFSAPPNLFCRDLQTKTTYALTTSGVLSAAMTPDGRSIAFIGGVASVSGTKTFVWNTQTHALTYTNSTTFTTANTPVVAISPNGQKVALLAYEPMRLMVADLRSNTVTTLTTSSVLQSQSGLGFSQDGRLLICALGTSANLIQNVYLYDLVAGTNVIVSQNFSAGLAASAHSDSPVISPDGRYIAYRSLATNLVSTVYNSLANVFVYDTASQTTVLASINAAGTASADDRSLQPQFSADGQMLFFQSWASDVAGTDFNAASDVFALDLAAVPATASGSGPTNAASGFVAQLLPAGSFAPALTIRWPLAAGQSYQVQYKTNLTDATWLNLPGGAAFLGGAGYASDAFPSPVRRFYRVLLNP